MRKRENSLQELLLLCYCVKEEGRGAKAERERSLLGIFLLSLSSVSLLRFHFLRASRFGDSRWLFLALVSIVSFSIFRHAARFALPRPNRRDESNNRVSARSPNRFRDPFSSQECPCYLTDPRCSHFSSRVVFPLARANDRPRLAAYFIGARGILACFSLCALKPGPPHYLPPPLAMTLS